MRAKRSRVSTCGTTRVWPRLYLVPAYYCKTARVLICNQLQIVWYGSLHTLGHGLHLSFRDMYGTRTARDKNRHICNQAVPRRGLLTAGADIINYRLLVQTDPTFSKTAHGTCGWLESIFLPRGCVETGEHLCLLPMGCQTQRKR